MMSNLSMIIADRAIEIVFTDKPIEKSRGIVNNAMFNFNKCDSITKGIDNNLMDRLNTLGLVSKDVEVTANPRESYFIYDLTPIGKAYVKMLLHNNLYGTFESISTTNTVSKRILLEELEEQTQIEMVEDVIFWALEHYAESKKGTTGVAVAYAIKERILEAEREENDVKRWTNK